MPKINQPKSALGKTLQKKGVKSKSKEPVWAGPESSAANGGITQSLLSRFLVCPERFRLLVIEGLKASEGWNKSLGYGNLWHTCEEALAGGNDWKAALKKYAQEQLREYQAPNDQTAIDHWYRVCLTQFPEYVTYWSKHPDVIDRKPLFQEQTFNVPYRLPSGRTVYLRGKFDSVDIVGSGKTAGVWLMENKTKGDINEEMLKRQLSSGFDLQTMLYLIALMNGPGREDSWPTWSKTGFKTPLVGVRYNVIRRPLSGGKGSIKQHQPSKSNPQGETRDEFYERLRKDYIAAEPEYWFMRWNIEISAKDIERFKRECLDPILESLCNWYSHVTKMDYPFKATAVRLEYRDDYVSYTPNWRLPFGIYNPLAEGGASDLDEYMLNGNEVGLTRTENLFPELT